MGATARGFSDGPLAGAAGVLPLILFGCSLVAFTGTVFPERLRVSAFLLGLLFT